MKQKLKMKPQKTRDFTQIIMTEVSSSVVILRNDEKLFMHRNFQFCLLNLSQMNHYRLYVFQSFIVHTQRTRFQAFKPPRAFSRRTAQFCSLLDFRCVYTCETLKLIKGLNISHQLALEVRKIVKEFPQKQRKICIFQ